MSKRMNKKNAILSIKQSMLLLNELYLNAKTRFIIRDCLYGLDLMEIDLSDKVNINLWIKPKDIQEARSTIQKI
ncbi:MAG: hypothetical protein P8Y97_22050 [Candidatus Lokiarchaeota archaeon]